jgi:mannose-1-phosphate guanylyltransferase
MAQSQIALTTTQDRAAGSLWTLVLAAGAGRRLSSITGGVPKQFWRRPGGRSLLQETLDRFAPLAPPTRTVVVIDAAHRVHMKRDRGGDPGITIVQPEDRGTALGVLLALVPVFAAGRDPIVALTPADHGVVDDIRFRRGVLDAANCAGSGAIVLFGVEPAAVHDDYGWITPGAGVSSMPLKRVAGFVEKPAAEVAAGLQAAGAVWNTMVLVARASAIRDLVAARKPGVVRVFDAVASAPAATRDAMLATVYPRLPRVDFSRDILTPPRNLSTYIWPESIGWSDLGTPERLHAWQKRDQAARRRAAVVTAA